MLRKISFALVAAAALGAAALRADFRVGLATAFMVATMAAGVIGVSAGVTGGSPMALGQVGAITIRTAACNRGEKAGPQWPGRSNTDYILQVFSVADRLRRRRGLATAPAPIRACPRSRRSRRGSA